MAFVLDASAAVAWASPDEAPSAELAAAVASGTGVAPALWPFEVQNVLTVLRRRGRLKGEDWEAAAGALRAIRIEIESADRRRVEEDVLKIADQYGLTVYDAAYLELALRRRIPLATLDDALRRTATSAGVEVL
jgi:predicted nucleic acid-binding protein